MAGTALPGFTRNRSGITHKRELNLAAHVILTTTASGTLNVSSFTDANAVPAHSASLDRTLHVCDRDVYLEIAAGGTASIEYALSGTYTASDGTVETKTVTVTGNVDGGSTQYTSFFAGTDATGKVGGHRFDDFTLLTSSGVTGANVRLIAGKALVDGCQAIYLPSGGNVTSLLAAGPTVAVTAQPESAHEVDASMVGGMWHFGVNYREISACTDTAARIGF